MTPEAQRIAIAEACGWKWIDTKYEQHWMTPDGYKKYPPSKYDKVLASEYLPDYLNDLNAMHEAEKTLTTAQLWRDYGYEIQSIIGAETDIEGITSTGRAMLITAKCKVRAEAFLRTLGLWKEDACPPTKR